jgi:SAM-dependent methyltransferase
MNDYETLYSDEGIYGTLTYGSPFVCKGLKCAVYLTQFGKLEGKKILCVGSGNGYEAVWFIKQGYDVTVLEMYHPDLSILKGKQVKGFAQNLPFDDQVFDLYFCCEMMEHVPEELNIAILKEAKRVSKEVFFTIADRDDPPYHTHINIHDMPYWYRLFKDLGFEFINVQSAGKLPLVAVGTVCLCGWGDGTIIHARH